MYRSWDLGRMRLVVSNNKTVGFVSLRERLRGIGERNICGIDHRSIS